MASRQDSKAVAAARSHNALARYQSMRDFEVTSEPRGGTHRQIPAAHAAGALPFVVQKHAATRLHYDFRLGWNGVLKSWAVTKGPSDDPKDKRLAVQVEDHPWEYRAFEGIIPKGQYGGGTVMVWDAGEWVPEGDAEQGLRDGHLKFELYGKKLKGKWVLVRMHGEAGGSAGKTNWLLIKEKDKFARDEAGPALTDSAPNSAATGRSMEEIAERKSDVWDSTNRNGNGAKKEFANKTGQTIATETRPAAAPRRQSNHALGKEFKQAPHERFPGFIAPQLAQQATAPPRGEDWVHELKLDGYRIQIHLRADEKSRTTKRKVQLLTRKGLDWTDRMPDVATAASALPASSAILDGEAVTLDQRGVSSFADLQAAFHEGRARFITYFAFDLLHLDGHNLRGLPLSARKKILGTLLQRLSQDSPLKMSEDFEADGKTVFEKACTLGAEGIVSKLNSAKYISGRSGTWLKLKCYQEQELVIGGFTLPSNGSAGIGALLLGYYEGTKLRYAGRSGTGFTQATHRALRAQLDRMERKVPPFIEVPREDRRGAHWVRPELVAQISFANWTRDNLVRQAAFKGLREDKPAKEVVREMPVQDSRESQAAPKPAKKSTTAARQNAAHQSYTSRPAITHPDKVLDAESGMTKQSLADYYVAIADHLLPHIAYRPLSVVRCPEGNGKPCFFQKHIGLGLPAGVKSISIKSRKRDSSDSYLTVDSSEGLVGLAQMGVLEIHPWGSRNESLEQPDRIVFDIDPDIAIGWKTITDTAIEFRNRLKKLGLVSYVKTTGGKGLHVTVPIRPDHDWPGIKEFAHRMVLEMERDRPNLYVTKMTKVTRKNRIYLDYLRNDREATSVAPFSPRARSGAPVSMPLAWKELDAPKAPVFRVSDFADWQIRLRRDPWRELLKNNQSLSGRALREK